MKVLLTGHLGYIGTAAAPALLARKHQVVGLDSGLFVSGAGPTGRGSKAHTFWDIRDVQPDDLRGFDAIVHLGALANDILDIVPPEIAHEVNYSAAIRLASMAKYAGVARFVFPSTCGVYPKKATGPLSERRMPNPQDAVSAMKLRVEYDLLRLGDSSFAPVILRLGIVCGVSPAMRHDPLLHWLIARCLSGSLPAPEMIPEGPHPLVHVEDVAGAIASALEAPQDVVANQVFNVALPGIAHSGHALMLFAHGESATIEDAQARGWPVGAVDGSKLLTNLPDFHFAWDIPHIVEQVRRAYEGSGLDANALQRLRLARKLSLKARQDSGALLPTLRPASARIQV
ncbi:MAG: SDR family oxidoreductase [Anaerolineae bacterium]|nr:SDR family oxidoreductase [Anaerolineae bacterium]